MDTGPANAARPVLPVPDPLLVLASEESRYITLIKFPNGPA
jgi:hypothetical protein